MDVILSEFVAHTSCDPGLGKDLLEANDWNFQAALSAYYVMQGLLPGEVPYAAAQLSSAYTRHQPSSYCNSALNGVINSPGSRLSHRKMPAFEVDDMVERKLTRGFSRATDNFNLVSQARTELAEDLDFIDQEPRPSSTKLEIPEHSFSLPDFSMFPDDLRDYLHKDLIENSTLVSLEQAGRLNWWYQRKISRKLWPLSTTGDGNCLLHAASLGMWGFHDRLLTLRKALHSLLTNSSYTDAFYRRWRWQTSLQNKEACLIFNEEEWEKEWQNLLKLSSSEPRQSSLQRNSSQQFYNSSDGSQSNQSEVYESLEELHVLTLAHVLKRAIIVIADTVLKDVTGEPFAPIPFGGIYLPLECPPSECHKTPLCLTFDSAHFSALVPMDDSCGDLFLESKASIPVTDPDNKLLPLQFAVDPGSELTWGQDENDSWVIARLTLTDKRKVILLNDYLDIRTIEVPAENVALVEKPHKEMNGHLAAAKSYDPYESDDSSPERGISCTGNKNKKNKAARQLQTVAKQFGSLGRSMSKKLKNIGNIAKRGGSFKGESSTFRQTLDNLKNKRTLSGLPMISRTATVDGSLNPRQVLIAILNTDKKPDYQKKLIQNYLHSAINRFENSQSHKASSSVYIGNWKPTVIHCLSNDCMYFSSTATSLCLACRAKQEYEEEQEKIQASKIKNDSIDTAVVTSGKSSFYTESDKTMRDLVEKLPKSSLVPNGLSDYKSSLFYDKFTYADAPYSSSLPNGKTESQSALRTIEETSTL